MECSFLISKQAPDINLQPQASRLRNLISTSTIHSGSENNQLTMDFIDHLKSLRVPSIETASGSTEASLYCCMVLDMFEATIALAPAECDLFGVATEVLRREADAVLFEILQTKATETFKKMGLQGSSWSTIQLNVSKGYTVTVTGISLTPTICRSLDRGEDLIIAKSFPGGHEAFINCAITTQRLKLEETNIAEQRVGESYTEISSDYEMHVEATDLPKIVAEVVDRYDFSGSVLDLACGTGLFGRTLHPSQQSRHQSLSVIDGIEISPGMARFAVGSGIYNHIHIGSMQRTVTRMHPVDHVCIFGAIYFLLPEEMSLVVSRVFQLARKSVTLAVDEIPVRTFLLQQNLTNIMN